MKKLLLAIMLFSMLYSCKKEEETDYASLIIGKWVNTHVNDVAVLTDGIFAFEYKTNKGQNYASGYTLDENNKTWLESNNFTYSVAGKKIIIDGPDQLGSIFHMEFEIISTDKETLKYSVTKFEIDNIEYPDTKIYTNKKVTVDLKNQFVGTWYGKSTTSGSTDNSFHYWDYFADGTYDYYYQDGSGNWINKPDNEGRYYLYGDLLASTYTNDLLSGGTGKAYECWTIRLEGNKMYWTGLRENGLITSFEMEKVAAPPATLFR
jgi:hypothetical protein